MDNTTPLTPCEKCGLPTLTKPVATKYYCQKCGRFSSVAYCGCQRPPYSMTIIVLHRCKNCQHIQPIWGDVSDVQKIAGDVQQ